MSKASDNAMAEARAILAGKKKAKPADLEPMKWRQGSGANGEYYSESDKGYNISRSTVRGEPVYSAWTPQKQWLGCFRGAKANQEAAEACNQHYREGNHGS